MLMRQARTQLELFGVAQFMRSQRLPAVHHRLSTVSCDRQEHIQMFLWDQILCPLKEFGTTCVVLVLLMLFFCLIQHILRHVSVNV